MGRSGSSPDRGPGEGPVMARGEQLAMTTCNECHGLDLRGAWQVPGDVVPDLAIVARYPREDFRKLMRTGVPIGGRDLGLMKEVASICLPTSRSRRWRT